MADLCRKVTPHRPLSKETSGYLKSNRTVMYEYRSVLVKDRSVFSIKRTVFGRFRGNLSPPLMPGADHFVTALDTAFDRFNDPRLCTAFDQASCESRVSPHVSPKAQKLLLESPGRTVSILQICDFLLEFRGYGQEAADRSGRRLVLSDLFLSIRMSDLACAEVVVSPAGFVVTR